MSKVTIPAEVADVIENLREGEYDNEGILTEVLDDDIHLLDVSTLRSIPFDTLLSALVNGYEREKTEAERYKELSELFNVKLLESYVSDKVFNEGFVDGVLQTLDILGITVAGINSAVSDESEVSANENK